MCGIDGYSKSEMKLVGSKRTQEDVKLEEGGGREGGGKVEGRVENLYEMTQSDEKKNDA